LAQTPKEGYGLGAHGFWRAVAANSGPLFRFMWDLEKSGELPIRRPSVVAANHFSHLDPVILGQTIGPVRYLAVDELYGTWPSFDKFITHFGAIPMTRTKIPLHAMRTAINHLEAGGVIGLFPEGRRVWTWGELPPQRGAAWLAQRTGVPLVPVTIWGTQESMGRGAKRIARWPVKIEVGDAIDPADFPGERVAATRSMMTVWEETVSAAIERMRQG